MRHLEPIHLAQLLKQCAGKWVAILDGEVVEARDTFDALVLAMSDRGISTDATILRVPHENEAELVGIG